MNLYATNRFKASINNLLSKNKNYGCVLEHLYAEFNNKSDNDLFEEGYRLNGNHNIARLLKLRMKSCGGKSKSEGFRLIVFVNIKDKNYFFLDIYPKTGPLAKSNMKKDERKNCLVELKSELNYKTIIKVELNSKEKKLKLLE